MKKIKLQDIQPYIRYVNNYKPNYSYAEKERIIYDYELMYIMEGEVEMHYDGKMYILKEGDIFYLKPFVKNYIVVDECKGFRTHCIHFDWMTPQAEDNFTAEEYYIGLMKSSNYYDKMERLKRRTNYEPWDFHIPNYVNDLPYEKIAPLFAQCFYTYSEYSPVAQLRTKAIFYEIIAILLEHYNKKTGRHPTHPQIISAIKYIKENYKQSISVPWLAERYGLSPKYFGALFKKIAGKSVSEFILDLRIYEAKEMLIRTDMTIEEISESIGFNNSFYFSKCFKAQIKISPSEFRNMMKLR